MAVMKGLPVPYSTHSCTSGWRRKPSSIGLASTLRPLAMVKMSSTRPWMYRKPSSSTWPKSQVLTSALGRKLFSLTPGSHQV